MSKHIDVKIPLLTTAALILATIFTFTVMNPPQCPNDFTQEQVNASNCAVGANIGIGMMMLLILIPLAIATLVLWVLYVIQMLRSKLTP